MESIPAGCFEMGDSSDGCYYSDECPVHNVCISAFEMDVCEVTNAQYAECVAAGACTAPYSSSSYTRPSYYGNPAYADFPVIAVDWHQAREYCTWAGKRLPREAEWEYAARGGLAGKRYPWGDAISGRVANYWYSGDPWDNDTSPVGYYAPNGYGLFDVAGNVFEWTNDCYGGTYYQYCVDHGIVNDPPGPATGTSRVVRGGGFSAETAFLRVANRLYSDPFAKWLDVGFRCARGGCECIDNDSDEYGDPGCVNCTYAQRDCDDGNPAVNPGATEGPHGDPTCGDALDNDCDGLIDSEDSSCKNLVAYYPFNGNANDESGNGHDGTVNGAILAEDRFGNADSAYLFDGVDDYITVTSDPDLEMEDEISIAAWINCSGGSYNPRIVNHSPEYGYCLATGGTSASRQIEFQFGEQLLLSGDGNTVTCGQWHFVAATATLSAQRIYLDGKLVNTGPRNGTPEYHTDLSIGRKPTWAYDAWGGLLDDIRIYSRALSENEICQLHHDPVAETLAAGNCSDGIDNDCDGSIDSDPECSSSP